MYGNIIEEIINAAAMIGMLWVLIASFKFEMLFGG
jgi:hypothetical protein